MANISLERMVEEFSLENLPINWNSFDLDRFSYNKILWDYQQEALENAIKALWKYYEDFENYQKGESIELNEYRKQKLERWYKNNGQDEKLDIKLSKVNRKITSLLEEYYPQTNGEINYEHFINRMSFWMATGSGKTLVLVKLIHILANLIKIGEIPPNDILFLTYRDDLINQLRTHVVEFNKAHSDVFIRLVELRNYDDVKRENPSLFKDQELTVFYYKSLNIVDEQGQERIDFKRYDNDGKWYVILDEAHKGDKQSSKAQHIYSILSRNGFLFNFSATFTDPRDIITTVFNFNLERFINSGYGKHIAILEQEIRAFKEKEDFNREEKQKSVIKSLILLTYVNKFYESINNVSNCLYHRPLLLTLVNSVNTEDADLKLFFRELCRIGKGEISDNLWQEAKKELLSEFHGELKFIYEDSPVKLDEFVFNSLSEEDILQYVYNATSSGEIEILIKPSNKKELAFKLKTSDKPFALIKIGDITEWLKNDLSGYEVNEKFDNESYFENLNKEDSEINILMGSRSFYEGWDSNRPNIINFINIGVGTDAKKFILQSVGRGVRIEPKKNKRQRLLNLYNAKGITDDLFNRIENKILPLESLFIIGTNRNTLKIVIEELKKEKGEVNEISLYVNEDAKAHPLLIPTYKKADKPLIEDENNGLARFEISKKNLELITKYLEYISDDRVFLANYQISPKEIKILRSKVVDERHYKFSNITHNNLELLVIRLINYFFRVIPEEFKDFKELDGEIKHFKNIKVYLKDISELKEKIRRVSSVKSYESKKNELEEKIKKGEISFDELERAIKSSSTIEDFEFNHKKIKIKYVANHYYIPIIMSEEEKITYINHIIKTPSEVKFIDDLEYYLTKGNKFAEFDWWYFSKIEEKIDDIYIPYYNPIVNEISKFYPDFIFWFKKADEYSIVFVDPKGTEHSNYLRKIDGYREIFEEDSKTNIIDHKSDKVTVRVLIKPEDIFLIPNLYRKYSFDKIENMLP